MSSTEGSGPEDPFAKPPPWYPPPGAEAPHGGAGPHEDAGPYGAAGPYGEQPDPLAGMPPLASRGRRLLARIIDSLIVGIPVYLVTAAIWNNWDYRNSTASYTESVIYALIYVAYQVVMLTGSGQSLGKKLMRIRVAMLADGSIPTTQAALQRESIYALVPVIPCCGSIFWLINVLWCTWDKPYRQCLHDKAARTVVVSAAR
jgi:uncharacterized RDD family membrane protein YckC